MCSLLWRVGGKGIDWHWNMCFFVASRKIFDDEEYEKWREVCMYVGV